MASPIEVEVNGDIERAFKNLKKKMAFEGVFKELKRRRYYEKPSTQRKRKQEEAERRRVKKMRRLMVHNQSKKVNGPRPYTRGPQYRTDSDSRDSSSFQSGYNNTQAKDE